MFFYCKIGQKIRQSETMLSSIGNQSRSNSKTVSRNIAIFLLATLLGSAPCLLFYFIRLTKIDFGVDFCHKLIYVKDWFLISCPMINAIIYSFLGRKFRRDLVVRNQQGEQNSCMYLASVLQEVRSCWGCKQLEEICTNEKY